MGLCNRSLFSPALDRVVRMARTIFFLTYIRRTLLGTVSNTSWLSAVIPLEGREEEEEMPTLSIAWQTTMPTYFWRCVQIALLPSFSGGEERRGGAVHRLSPPWCPVFLSFLTLACPSTSTLSFCPLQTGGANGRGGADLLCRFSSSHSSVFHLSHHSRPSYISLSSFPFPSFHSPHHHHHDHHQKKNRSIGVASARGGV